MWHPLDLEVNSLACDLPYPYLYEPREAARRCLQQMDCQLQNPIWRTKLSEKGALFAVLAVRLPSGKTGFLAAHNHVFEDDPFFIASPFPGLGYEQTYESTASKIALFGARGLRVSLLEATAPQLAKLPNKARLKHGGDLTIDHVKSAFLSLLKDPLIQLLQTANTRGWHPLDMAITWRGAPEEEHLHFDGQILGARRLSEPLLNVLLQGFSVEENPLVSASRLEEPRILFEDQTLLVIDKPSGMPSVPGHLPLTCVQDWAQNYLSQKNPTSPLIIHRLDMATSGLMILAKTKIAHEGLQKQFLNKSVTKCYEALLQGELKLGPTQVELALLPDALDRPRQCVKAQGRPSVTRFDIIHHQNGRSRVLCYPLTGRTHQIRIHCAHRRGLNAPIIGDRLYGIAASRLHLHAKSLRFIHPVTEKTLYLDSPTPF